jgi:hypothetical protein
MTEPTYIVSRAELDAERALADDLAAELVKAREMVASWAAYASEYFQEKWNLAADLGHLDAVIAEYEKTRGR